MPKVSMSQETYERLREEFTDDEPETGERQRIVIVDNRGLTFVGRTTLIPNDLGYVTIKKARCIIYWGTQKHLAELCSGPTSKTTLGAKETVKVPAKNIVAVYEAGGDWGG